MSRRVLITGARAPVALHWCRLFAEAGWDVHAADCLAHPLARFSRKVGTFHRFPSPVFEAAAFAAAFDGLVEDLEPDLILPTCEEVFHLAFIAAEKPWQSKLFAPSFETLMALHDKAAFNALVAERVPAFAPAFKRVESRADLEGLNGADWVLKPCFSRFATDVLVRPSQSDLVAINPNKSEPWLAQTFLPGREVCLSAVVAKGRLVAAQAYHPVVRLRGGVGAGVTFEAASKATNARLGDFVEQFVAGETFSGQLSFDFREDGDGQWKVIECNPRSTSGFHFFGPGDGLVDAVIDGQKTAFTAPDSRVMGERFPTLLLGGLKGLRLLSRMETLSAWPGDSLGPFAQLRAFRELWALKQKHKCSLEAASTVDICWNQPLTESLPQT